MSNMITVEFHENGRPERMGLKGVADLDHLTEVVVVGKTKKYGEKNVLVIADKIYVRP